MFKKCIRVGPLEKKFAPPQNFFPKFKKKTPSCVQCHQRKLTLNFIYPQFISLKNFPHPKKFI